MPYGWIEFEVYRFRKLFIGYILALTDVYQPANLPQEEVLNEFEEMEDNIAGPSNSSEASYSVKESDASLNPFKPDLPPDQDQPQDEKILQNKRRIENERDLRRKLKERYHDNISKMKQTGNLEKEADQKVLEESDPICPKSSKLITLYNIHLNVVLCWLMFITGLQYNISQMIGNHQVCEWGVDRRILAIEPSLLIALIAVSCFVCGILGDKFGRKTVLLGVVYTLTFGVLIAGTAGQIYQYMVGRCIIGGSLGALFNLCIVHWLESSPCNIRRIGVLLLMIFTSLGHASIVFVDSQISKPYGWRWGMLSTLCLLLPLIILVHLSEESPLYLLASGQETEAHRVSKKCNMTKEDTEGSVFFAIRGNLGEVLGPQYRWITVTLIFVFGLHRLVETGLIFGVPHLITLDYCQEDPQYNATLETSSCWEYSNRDYDFIMIFASLGIPGLMFGAFLQSRLIRLSTRTALFVLTLLVGVLLLWCAICDYFWLFELKLGLLRILICAQDQIFSVCIPAVFPTQIRNSGSGLVRASGILLSSVGPFLTISFFSISIQWCLVTLSVLALIRIPMMWKLDSVGRKA